MDIRQFFTRPPLFYNPVHAYVITKCFTLKGPALLLVIPQMHIHVHNTETRGFIKFIIIIIIIININCMHSINSYIFRSQGRPRIMVDLEDIEFLSGLRFSYVDIAKILGVSRSTLYRRLEEEGISQHSKYSDISDNDLDREISEIKLDHPNDGERLLIGHLAARGIIVQRVRVRASIHRVDPENTAIRRSVTIRRRSYHVQGPNSLWHVDGNHKMETGYSWWNRWVFKNCSIFKMC